MADQVALPVPEHIPPLVNSAVPLAVVVESNVPLNVYDKSETVPLIVNVLPLIGQDGV
jgi:hypothetical protein